MLTVLHLLNSPASTFSASMTISPAITALVVAMAGMMLPAMAEGEGRVEDMIKELGHETAGPHLMSNLLFCWMWKANALRFADAATKSIATRSSYRSTGAEGWVKQTSLFLYLIPQQFSLGNVLLTEVTNTGSHQKNSHQKNSLMFCTNIPHPPPPPPPQHTHTHTYSPLLEDGCTL